MKELITEVTTASISSGPMPLTTDDVASQYEKKLTQSIAMKVLASQGGTPLNFTKEESAYLAKKAYEESQFSEVKVITPDPTITLKKGNTEINIRNAATLVKKMEEIYPSPNRQSDTQMDTPVTEQEVDELIEELETEAEEDEPKRIMIPQGEATMKVRFQKIVNHPTTEVSPEVAKCVAPDEKTFQERFGDIKTVNKNAYEIRTDVLAMALDFVKWQTEIGMSLKKTVSVPTDESLFTTAQKFYKFVENRR